MKQLLAATAAAVLLVAAIAWWAGVGPAELRGAWKSVTAFLEDHPAALFWALVFLPGLPVPTSALLFTAGLVWRERPVMACGLAFVAMALNLSWTYWLAAHPARRLAGRLLEASAFELPELPRHDQLKLVLILKLTPGIPFFVQNYVSGFLRAPFRIFLPISLVCNGSIGSGIVLSGAGLAGGNWMPVVSGLGLIVAGAILAQFLRGWMGKRKSRGAQTQAR